MSSTISRRTLLKSAVLASGAVGVGAVLPRGFTGFARASGSGTCRLGGNGSFISAEESKLGQTLSAQRVYKAWDEEIFTPDVTAAQEKGRLLVISIFPANKDGSSLKYWADIAAGKHDKGLSSIATQLKDFDKTHTRKVGLCFHHEPENERDGSPGDMHLGTEADFRGAAKHFFSYLSSHGVTNIRQTLILFSSTYGMGLADAYWPGNDYVDRVGADGYNWYGTPNQPDSDWRSFQQIVQGVNDYAVAKGKLAWICETGTLEDPQDSGRKARWVTDMGATLKTMPKIRAVMWYEGGENGWSLSLPPQGSAAALSAFKGLLGQTYFY